MSNKLCVRHARPDPFAALRRRIVGFDPRSKKAKELNALLDTYVRIQGRLETLQSFPTQRKRSAIRRHTTVMFSHVSSLRLLVGSMLEISLATFGNYSMVSLPTTMFGTTLMAGTGTALVA
ncbi:MAG: hypothetical protein AAGI44_02015 [Pseudomonadota bacterium]